jgi:hypothetical protein
MLLSNSARAIPRAVRQLRSRLRGARARVVKGPNGPSSVPIPRRVFCQSARKRAPPLRRRKLRRPSVQVGGNQNSTGRGGSTPARRGSHLSGTPRAAEPRRPRNPPQKAGVQARRRELTGSAVPRLQADPMVFAPVCLGIARARTTPGRFPRAPRRIGDTAGMNRPGDLIQFSRLSAAPSGGRAGTALEAVPAVATCYRRNVRCAGRLVRPETSRARSVIV